MKKFIILFFIGITLSGFSQNQNDSLLSKSETGNKNDILSKLLQVAYKGNFLSSSGSQYSLKFTPYGIATILDSTCKTDKKYAHTKFMRNFSVNSDFESSSKNNAITAIDPGVTWAFWNKRDNSVYNYKKNTILISINDTVRKQFDTLLAYGHRTIMKKIHDSLVAAHKNPNDTTLWKPPFRKRSESFLYALSSYGSTKPNKLDPIISNAIKEKVITSLDSNFSMRKQFLDRLNNDIANKPFAAFSPSFHFDPKSGKIDSLDFKVQYLQGLFSKKGKKAWELEVDLVYDFLRDTLVTGFQQGDLRKRMIFSPSIGVNKVLLSAPSDPNTSLLELKVTAGDEDITTGLYPKEKNNTVDFETVLRIRVSSGLWLPLDFKYDPKASSWLGFISLTYNFVPDSSSSTQKSKN